MLINQRISFLLLGGKVFEFVEKNDLIIQKFISTLSKVKSRIFFHFSPLQKVKLISLMKSRTGKAVLAVGDGVHHMLGWLKRPVMEVVFVAEEDSRQASDILIGKFYKLVLIHGSWCYQRLSKIIICSLYKNTIFYMAQFLV